MFVSIGLKSPKSTPVTQDQCNVPICNCPVHAGIWVHLTLFFTEAEMTLAYSVVSAGNLLSLARA